MASGQSDTIAPVFSVEEIKPEYPGGEKALIQFISDNLVYPKNAFKKGIQGTVYTQFILDEEGNVVEPTIIRGIDPELDAEALRLIKLMPKWQPGMQRGKPVKVRFTMPLKFKITGVINKPSQNDTLLNNRLDAAVGVYFGGGFNALVGSFSDYVGHQAQIEIGTHFSINRLNFIIPIEFGFGTTIKQDFDANGFWRKGRGAGILSPQFLVGYTAHDDGKWELMPYGGLSLNGFLPSKLESTDPKKGFQLDNASIALGTTAILRYRYKDKGRNRFNTALLRFRIGYNYMKFNDFLKGNSVVFSVSWGKEQSTKKRFDRHINQAEN